MAGIKASKIRRVARKIKLPCGGSCGGSFSPKQANDNISRRSSVVTAKSKNISANTENPESTTKTLCPICLEPLIYNTGTKTPGEAIFTAQCSHSFHFTCISSNVRHGNVTCPICRAYWTQLPRDLYISNPSTQTSDPILRILDDSIETFRVHRRSSLRSARRYDDDDPIEPPQHTPTTSSENRLHFTLIPLAQSLPNNGAYNFCLSIKLAQQQATDLVLVASPNGPHLRLLKQSMALVVFSLRSIDRLAIVTYSSTATRAFPLRRMTCHGKRSALQVIDRLFYTGDAHPDTGLRKGIKILEDRSHQNPQSSILHLSDTPTPTSTISQELPDALIHQFHVGFAYGTTASTGLVMHEFEEFLARLLGGVIRDTHLRIGEDGEVVRLGELRGGEERRIPLLYLNDEISEFVLPVSYSYAEGRGEDECLRTGEIEVSIDDKSRNDYSEVGGQDMSIVGRASSVENWDYHDPYMARRWAKHLHGYRL